MGYLAVNPITNKQEDFNQWYPIILAMLIKAKVGYILEAELLSDNGICKLMKSV